MTAISKARLREAKGVGFCAYSVHFEEYISCWPVWRPALMSRQIRWNKAGSQLQFSPASVISEAHQDLQDIRTYYLKEAGARVARYVAREITAAFECLAATPGAGHVRADLTGEPVKFSSVFSYLIVYDPAMEPIGIARVLHGSRDLDALFRARSPRP